MKHVRLVLVRWTPASAALQNMDQLLAKHPPAHRVQEKVDAEPADVKSLGIIPEDREEEIRVGVIVVRQWELLYDEVDEDGQVGDDVAAGHEHQEYGRLEVPVLVLLLVIVLIQVLRLDPFLDIFAALVPGASQAGDADDDERVENGNGDDGDDAVDGHLDEVHDGEELLVLFEYGAHVEIGIQAHAHHVIGRYGDGDEEEKEGADVSGADDVADLLEFHREEDGEAALDGEGKDEAGGVVGEQVGKVLEWDAHDRVSVDYVGGTVGEVPAAYRREDPGDEHADKVDGVGCCQGEQVNVRRDGLHFFGGKDDYAQRVADEAHGDEDDGRSYVHLEREGQLEVVWCRAPARVVGRVPVCRVVGRHGDLQKWKDWDASMISLKTMEVPPVTKYFEPYTIRYKYYSYAYQMTF